MATITFKNVVKEYDKGNPVIPNLNLEIKDKEFIILVGPSGCGKSTTLRMIAGLEEITSGTLLIDDIIVNNVAPKDRDIAMVFQSYALYPHLTVYKNMAFALKLRRIKEEYQDKKGNTKTRLVKISEKEIHDKVMKTAKLLNLVDYLDRKPKALSGGQRQRVALGRAMVRNPKVFLLDEPLSNLDAKLRTEMRSEIIKLHKELQTTFVYVTHDQTEAMTMADRIVVLKDGVIQQYDTPQNLFKMPANLFVAGFIGSPEMNFFNGKIIKKASEIYFSFNNIDIKIPKEKAYNLETYILKDVIMGIRPDEIYKVDDNLKSSIMIKVDIAELMGSEIFIYFYIDNNKYVAKLSAENKIKTDDEINIQFNSDAMHFFDVNTKMAICH